MKSKTEILAQLNASSGNPEWVRALGWVLDGGGWKDARLEYPRHAATVLAWDETGNQYLVATFYLYNNTPQWVVCDKDRRTNITRWTSLE